jgi:hypothetical protein
MQFISDRWFGFFSGLLSESGALSAQRFNFLATAAISNLVFWGVWATLCFHGSKILEIPDSIIVIYSLANGISMAGKLGQYGMQSKGNGNGKNAPVSPQP